MKPQEIAFDKFTKRLWKTWPTNMDLAKYMFNAGIVYGRINKK